LNKIINLSFGADFLNLSQGENRLIHLFYQQI
jgi:hypothetical protein